MKKTIITLLLLVAMMTAGVQTALALKGVPVKPTDDVDKEYQLIPLDSL